MPKESRECRPLSDGPLLPLATNPSSTSSLRSPDTGTQRLTIQYPWRFRQDPHHNPNPEKDVTRRLQVYSYRDGKPTEIDAIFAHDLHDQCWISEEAVERLRLTRMPMPKEQYGVLARKTFTFSGVATIDWIDNGLSKPTKCSIVPSGIGVEFEVFLQSNMVPLASAPKIVMDIPQVLSDYLPPNVEQSSSPVTGLSTDYTGSFDGEGLDGNTELIDENSNEAKWADKWMSDLNSKVHANKRQRFVRDKDSPPPVKIAVLDTGIDLGHSYIKGCKNANRIKKFKSFVSGDEKIDDGCGHGTHVAALLLKVAPECQIYVAKVASGSTIPTDHKIAEALEWAITEKVDVISMSFGMDKDHPTMQAQISRAYTENIIMFAAASNRGLNYEVTFPAREERVICIYSTDGNGGKSSCNPTRLKNSGYHFATVGVAVKSAWPVKLSLPANTPSASEPGAADANPPKVNKSPERRMTGTSFATPIVAAIAAYILDFARMNGIGEELYQRLRCRQWMQAIFADHMAVDCDQFHYIRPWKLFADNRSDEDIILFIKDTLTRELGGCQSAEII